MSHWFHARLFCTLLILPASVLAATYQAYQFTDRSLETREDLRALLAFRNVTVSESSLGDLVEFEVRGVRWQMDRDVFGLLARAKESEGLRPLAPELAALAAKDLAIDGTTLSRPSGQVHAMLKPLVTAGVPAGLAPFFDDPDFKRALFVVSSATDVSATSLTNAQKLKFAFVQGALMWRARGGGLYVKTSGSQTWRYLFTVRPMMTLAELGGATRSWQIGGEFWTGLLQSWGRYFDLGRLPNQEDRFRDLAEMTRIGSRIGDSVADDLENRGYDASALRIAGRQFAGCYDYAWENLAGKTWGDRSVAPFVEIAAVPTQWAELCAGASFGSALMKSLLTKPNADARR